MEEIAKKFEDLAEKIPEYESDICNAINCIERATFTGVEIGKTQLKIAENRIKEMDDLIASALTIDPLPPDVNDRLMQVFVSFRPRLQSFIEQLKALIENPPKESLFPPIDDSEIYPKKDDDKNESENKSNDLTTQTEPTETNQDSTTNNNNDNQNSKIQDIQEAVVIDSNQNEEVIVENVEVTESDNNESKQ